MLLRPSKIIVTLKKQIFNASFTPQKSKGTPRNHAECRQLAKLRRLSEKKSPKNIKCGTFFFSVTQIIIKSVTRDNNFNNFAAFFH